MINHQRMITHQVDRNQRVDFCRIATKRQHGITHGRKVHKRRDAREILHQDTRRTECDLAVRRAFIVEPSNGGLDIAAADRAAVFVSQKIFKHDF